ncbi:MAG: N-acetylmuramoyl-L-alanine amidase [Desulfobacterales bacterium]
MSPKLMSIVMLLALVLVLPAGARADTAREQYFKAENAYKKLVASPEKRKYRHNWLRVIKDFYGVYAKDPRGSWAAAGLYRAGATYVELHRYSGLAADREAGIQRLSQLRKEFPRSAYRAKAAKYLKNLPAAQKPPPPAPVTRKPDAAASARRKFEKAEACRTALLKNPRRTKHRDVWLGCINQYQSAYKVDPEGPTAADCLYRMGVLYRQLAGYSKNRSDRETGDAYLRRVVKRFPDSAHSARSEALLAGTSASHQDDRQPVLKKPTSDSAGQASSLHTVSGLRYWSNPNYTRVVVDTSGKTPYFHHLLKKDPDLKKPQRLYIDLQNARLNKNFPRVIPINDDLLTDARAGQYTNDTVRVVVDIKSYKTYKIFSLMNPFRIVIDVWGKGGAEPAAAQQEAALKPPSGKIPPGSIARSLALGVSRIVVDAGHGGKDPGARGYYRTAREKHITLAIAKKLKRKLETKIGCEVIMTRTNDKFLTLEERTALANTKEADLFISIHVNAHRHKSAYGTETYFLNLATDEESIRVAAMENATSTKNISDLQTILMDLMQNAKINESSRLASYVQRNMVQQLRKKYGKVRDKGVKQAPFYVLLGAQMPAILVETAFISNPRECKRLMDPAYQDRLCDGISQGIEQYIKATSPTAYQDKPPPGRQNG